MTHQLDLAQITRRLRALENHIEITNLLASLAHSADAGDKFVQREAYHHDCVMDVGPHLPLITGQDAITALLDNPAHIAAREAGMVHFASLPHIIIDGDSATAYGYLQIVIPIDSDANVARNLIRPRRDWVSGG
jgi:hypothetical protein